MEAKIGHYRLGPGERWNERRCPSIVRELEARWMDLQNTLVENRFAP